MSLQSRYLKVTCVAPSEHELRQTERERDAQVYILLAGWRKVTQLAPCPSLPFRSELAIQVT